MGSWRCRDATVWTADASRGANESIRQIRWTGIDARASF
jgi:hypothetical protein